MGTMIVGRSRDCDIVLDNLGVSRMHAELGFDNGEFVVDDLGSANGSVLNGTRVEKASLGDGDVLQIGKFQLHIALPREGDDSPSALSPSDLDLTFRRPD
jgi:pSer/pThr/pTyr-binding forkhead associated (FHA) protein